MNDFTVMFDGGARRARTGHPKGGWMDPMLGYVCQGDLTFNSTPDKRSKVSPKCPCQVFERVPTLSFFFGGMTQGFFRGECSLLFFFLNKPVL